MERNRVRQPAGIPTVLAIRADAGPKIGTGHVMRCLALAEAWREVGGDAIFFGFLPSKVADWLAFRGFSHVALNAHDNQCDEPVDTLHALATAGISVGSWCVLDGYHFSPTLQRALRAEGFRLLILDDYQHRHAYEADILLNQNAHASKLTYQLSPGCDYLSGPSYALLRREFRDYPQERGNQSREKMHLLVTLGGADPDNVTMHILLALERCAQNFSVTVILGIANSHVAKIKEIASRLTYPIQVEVAAPNMPSIMGNADLAISAGGSTCWEMCLMGLPFVTVILADNQVASAEILDKQGVAPCLGKGQTLDASQLADLVSDLLSNEVRRFEMRRLGRELVDGHGADRVVRCMREIPLQLRYADMKDSRMYWEWANDPKVRKSSFHLDTISWTDHQSWFSRKLLDRKSIMYVAEDSNCEPVGQVRFEITGDCAVISLSLAAPYRRKNLGHHIIREALRKLSAIFRIFNVIAYIRPDNYASIKSFTAAGFSEMGNEIINGHLGLRFIVGQPLAKGVNENLERAT